MTGIGKYELNENIKSYIDKNGIKQSYVANKIGMGLSSFNYLLNNKKVLTATEYMLICEALGVGLETFIPKKSA